MTAASAIELHASGAESTAGSGTAVDIEAHRNAVELQLEVSAVSGTNPLLTVYLESGPTSSGPWKQHHTVTANATSVQKFAMVGLLQHVRARWTIGGTGSPSFTFKLSGQAHTSYAGLDDFGTLGIKPDAFSAVPDTDKSRALLQATADAADALNSTFKLPITAWGQSLRGRVVHRATYYLLKHRGFSPDSDADRLVIMDGGLVLEDGRATAVEKWFQQISRGDLKPVEIVDQTPDTYEGGGFVISDAPR